MELVTLVAASGRSWCDPEIDPFLFRTNEEWLERIVGTSGLLRPRLKDPGGPRLAEPTRWVSMLEHVDFDIVMIVGRTVVSSWVGRLGYGGAVEFGRQSLTPIGEEAAPAFRTAAGLAISWYVDTCLPALHGIPAVTRVATDEWLNMARYRSVERDFNGELTRLRHSSEPPHAHWVVAHIRHLGDGHPSDEKVATAPRHLAPFMGPHDTWVRGHERHGRNVDSLETYLRGRASVVDAAGTAYWIQ